MKKGTELLGNKGVADTLKNSPLGGMLGKFSGLFGGSSRSNLNVEESPISDISSYKFTIVRNFPQFDKNGQFNQYTMPVGGPIYDTLNVGICGYYEERSRAYWQIQ